MKVSFDKVSIRVRFVGSGMYRPRACRLAYRTADIDRRRLFKYKGVKQTLFIFHTNHHGSIPYRPQKVQKVNHRGVPLSSTADRVSPRLSLDSSKPKLSSEEKSTLQANIQLLRDAIVLFTATGAARGVGGHTGEYMDTSDFDLK